MQTCVSPIRAYFPQKNRNRRSSIFTKTEQYWHTARHLRPSQFWGQIRHRLLRPSLIEKLSSVPSQRKPISLTSWPSRPRSYLGQRRFCFLNREYDLGWLTPDIPHLWQYNLHYFDYLHQPGMDRNTGMNLMRSWIQDHPVSRESVGWEPYPLSLRLVNWIKFCSSAESVPEEIVLSIALQAANLKRQLEYRLMGNHLFANAKALWFAGAFLDNKEFLSTGKKIVLKELREQFLQDGGHFERSPMYHTILLEDLLDMINLCQSDENEKEALTTLGDMAGRSLAWLKIMVDPEDKIPLLNDSAHGVATPYQDIKAYARRLGIEPRAENISQTAIGEWGEYNLSGYRVLSKNSMRLIFDTALTGPEYLPGHAHCDMLSVLLDFEGKNIFTDTGVYEYEETRCRAYSRGTAAHNTVVLDGLEQAELWKGFRMGRRGHPVNFRRCKNSLGCSHTGFDIWQKGLVHDRTLSLHDNGFELTDRVTGPAHHRFEAFFHCAPDVRVHSHKNGTFTFNDLIHIEPWGADVRLTMSDYYPEFGIKEKRPCLVMSGSFSHKAEFGLRCTYSF